MQNPKLELYYFEECPYCQRVLNAIQRLNLKITFNNIHENSKHFDHLVSVTGKKTVPCLFIDGKPMFESLDIIAWMENNLETLSKN